MCKHISFPTDGLQTGHTWYLLWSDFVGTNKCIGLAYGYLTIPWIIPTIPCEIHLQYFKIQNTNLVTA